MFIIYPLILGIIIGYLRGGKLTWLMERTLYWKPLAMLALLIQLFIFSNLPVLDSLPRLLLEALHYLSYLCLVVFVGRNIKVQGILPTGAGIVLNATAIFLNGGYMPTIPENLKNTSVGRYAAAIEQGSTVHNSSAITGNTLLPWLGDIFYIPSWVPLSNVISIGDILISAGIILYLTVNMKKEPDKAAN